MLIVYKKRMHTRVCLPIVSEASLHLTFASYFPHHCRLSSFLDPYFVTTCSGLCFDIHLWLLSLSLLVIHPAPAQSFTFCSFVVDFLVPLCYLDTTAFYRSFPHSLSDFFVYLHDGMIMPSTGMEFMTVGQSPL